jgi:FkbM family methyltransferase
MTFQDKLTQWIAELKPVDEVPNGVHSLLSGKKIVLYGAGDGLVTFASFVLSRYGLQAEVVLDSKFKDQTSVLGIPACSPCTFKPSRELQENGLAIITVGKREYHPEIIATLKKLGFCHIVFAWGVYEYHLPSVTPEKREFLGDYYFHNREAILAAYALLADQESKAVFEAFLQTHLTRKCMDIPCQPLQEQYFPPDIALSRGKARMINCGSYTGDTVIQAYSRFNLESVVCFEPDPANFKVLQKNIEEKCPRLAGKAFLFPCGVFSQEKQLRFHGGNKSNSMLSDDGDTIIQCISLDHAIPHFDATFITMDIEGAEYEAIKGARSLLCESRPDLAVCVYHTPSHLWEIPLFIHSLQAGYTFYLRNYTSFTSETVLYAVSEKGKA